MRSAFYKGAKHKRSNSKPDSGQAEAGEKGVSYPNGNGLPGSETAQLKSINSAPAQQAPVQRQSNNNGLPDNLRNGIESMSGMNMDDVRVHYNSSKPAQLQAHAFAQGNDIHLASGQEKHLPHEAWHVVQQKQGRVKPTMQLKKGVHVNDDTALEKEADVMGARALSEGKRQPTATNTGKEAPAQQSTLQRKTAETTGDAVIQRVKVMRFMNAKDRKVSALAEADLQAYRDFYNQQLSQEELMRLANAHAESQYVGPSPFISVGANPWAVAWGADTSTGGVNDIVQNVDSLIWFDVPREYVYPCTNSKSLAETELLLLLPPDKSLLDYIERDEQKRPVAHPNPYKGMDQTTRQASIANSNPQFTKLRVMEAERNQQRLMFHTKEQPVSAPWEETKQELVRFRDIPLQKLGRVLQHIAENCGGSAQMKKDILGATSESSQEVLGYIEQRINEDASMVNFIRN